MSQNATPGIGTRAFISHNSKDKPFVRTLEADLQANGCTAWVDENQMYAGDSLLQGISTGLQNNDYVLAVFSAHFAASNWAQQEISAAVAMQNSGKGIKVIVLRLDDTPLPALLQGSIYVDFRGDYTAGLNQLLRALTRPVATPIQAPVTLSVDRAKLVAVLNSLDSVSLTSAINHIAGAGAHDIPQQPVPIRVQALLGFAEGAVGPGLNAVASVVVQLFPNTASKIGPFR